TLIMGMERRRRATVKSDLNSEQATPSLPRAYFDEIVSKIVHFEKQGTHWVRSGRFCNTRSIFSGQFIYVELRRRKRNHLWRIAEIERVFEHCAFVVLGQKHLTAFVDQSLEKGPNLCQLASVQDNFVAER